MLGGKCGLRTWALLVLLFLDAEVSAHTLRRHATRSQVSSKLAGARHANLEEDDDTEFDGGGLLRNVRDTPAWLKGAAVGGGAALAGVLAARNSDPTDQDDPIKIAGLGAIAGAAGSYLLARHESAGAGTRGWSRVATRERWENRHVRDQVAEAKEAELTYDCSDEELPLVHAKHPREPLVRPIRVATPRIWRNGLLRHQDEAGEHHVLTAKEEEASQGNQGRQDHHPQANERVETGGESAVQTGGAVHSEPENYDGGPVQRRIVSTHTRIIAAKGQFLYPTRRSRKTDSKKFNRGHANLPDFSIIDKWTKRETESDSAFTKWKADQQLDEEVLVGKISPDKTVYMTTNGFWEKTILKEDANAEITKHFQEVRREPGNKPITKLKIYATGFTAPARQRARLSPESLSSQMFPNKDNNVENLVPMKQAKAEKRFFFHNFPQEMDFMQYLDRTKPEHIIVMSLKTASPNVLLYTKTIERVIPANVETAKPERKHGSRNEFAAVTADQVESELKKLVGRMPHVQDKDKDPFVLYIRGLEDHITLFPNLHQFRQNQRLGEPMTREEFKNAVANDMSPSGDEKLGIRALMKGIYNYLEKNSDPTKYKIGHVHVARDQPDYALLSKRVAIDLCRGMAGPKCGLGFRRLISDGDEWMFGEMIKDEEQPSMKRKAFIYTQAFVDDELCASYEPRSIDDYPKKDGENMICESIKDTRASLERIFQSFQNLVAKMSEKPEMDRQNIVVVYHQGIHDNDQNTMDLQRHACNKYYGSPKTSKCDENKMKEFKVKIEAVPDKRKIFYEALHFYKSDPASTRALLDIASKKEKPRLLMPEILVVRNVKDKEKAYAYTITAEGQIRCIEDLRNIAFLLQDSGVAQVRAIVLLGFKFSTQDNNEVDEDVTSVEQPQRVLSFEQLKEELPPLLQPLVHHPSLSFQSDVGVVVASERGVAYGKDDVQEKKYLQPLWITGYWLHGGDTKRYGEPQCT